MKLHDGHCALATFRFLNIMLILRVWFGYDVSAFLDDFNGDFGETDPNKGLPGIAKIKPLSCCLIFQNPLSSFYLFRA